MAYKRLGDLLIASHKITQQQLEEGLRLQKESKERLGTVLINNNIISEYELIDALQMQLGIDYVDLSKCHPDASLSRFIPRHLAEEYCCVAVKMVHEDLYVALADPTNFVSLEQLTKISKKKIIPLISTAKAINHAISVVYGNVGAAKAIEEMNKYLNNTSNPDTEFVTNSLANENIENAPAIRLVNSIIERAINENASDIHFEPRQDSFRVRMRIDGMLREVLLIPKNLQSAIISRIKIMSGLDIAEKRIGQDGRFSASIKNKNVDVRISTLPTVYGEKIVARILDKSQGALTKEQLGLRGKDLEKFDKILNIRNGVVLIVGPTGSGKTSTMYTMIDNLNKEEVNMVTLEDPVEYNIDRINQVQINEKQGLTFASGLRSILRQDPDIIAVGEIRDEETAEIAMRAAITGHIVLSTIHTNDSIGTIDRLADMGVPAYLIASALKAVVSQRLVRKNCPECKQSYLASPQELMALGLDKNYKKVFYRSVGCPNCFNTGYKGRTGVFEIFNINNDVRNLINENAGKGNIEHLIKNSDFTTIYDNALALLDEGITSVEEVLRVFNEEN